MEENKELEIDNKIILANNELEAHNFEKAERICEDALELDSENPNIYLILLLAKYQVTELEDLRRCDVDQQSILFQKIRKYGDKELNKELDRYIPVKEYSDYNKEIKNSEQVVEKSLDELNQNTKKIIKLIASSGLIKYIKNEFKTLFEKRKPESESDMSYTGGCASMTILGCTMILLLGSLAAAFFCLVDSDKYYIDSICVYFIIIIFWLKVSKLNYYIPIQEDNLPDKKNENEMSDFRFKSIKHIFLYIICVIVINVSFLFSLTILISSSFEQGDIVFHTDSKVLDVILGFSLGLIPFLMVTYTYQKIYNFYRNIFYIMPPDVKQFLKDNMPRRNY